MHDTKLKIFEQNSTLLDFVEKFFRGKNFCMYQKYSMMYNLFSLNLGLAYIPAHVVNISIVKHE